MPRILIIEARFYEEIADQLALSAVLELDRAGNIKHDFVKVPGCFEIPAALSMAIASKKYDGFVVLGCVIRGETTHYDYVCGEAARGVNELAMKYNTPVGFGVITAENRKQADVRADAKQKNVGGRAAIACLDMLKLKKMWEAKK